MLAKNLNFSEGEMRAIEQEFIAYQNQKKDWGMDFDSLSQDTYLKWMTEEADLKRLPVTAGTSSKKGIKGWIYQIIKKQLVKYAQVFIKFGFVRQQNFNDLTLVLANTVVTLEKRVAALEEELQRRT